MIRNEAIARELSEALLDCSRRLHDTVRLVEVSCDADELKVYRLAIGKVLGEMLFEVMNPLYREHPSIKPQELQ
jgi:hypothetical protein